MEAPAKPPSSLPSTNPPSVEVAYKRKCIALKKRLNEIEAENELMRTRNRRGWKYIQKMRLESCILLDRLAKVTGMAEEAQAAGVTPELRAKAAAMMSNAPTVEDGSEPVASGSAAAAAENGAPYLDDETEGSSEEHPPTPQDRPLRTKRRRLATCKEDEGWDEDGTGPGHPTCWRSPKWRSPMLPAPKQEEFTSSFRIQTGSNGGPASSRRPSAQDTPGNGNGNGTGAGAGAANVPSAPADAPTTPMDMDTKEPKVEGQG